MKMEEKYLNPKDSQELENIINEIKKCPNILAIKDLLYKIFPTLIHGFTRGYSSDYPKLTEAWHVMCKAVKTLPKGLILIEFVPPSIRDNGAEKYSLLRKFLDIMTYNGFVARRTLEFSLCPTCKLAIPSYGLYKKMKFRKPHEVPQEWDFQCSSCEPFENILDEKGNPTLFSVPKEEIKNYLPEVSTEN